MFEKKRLKNFGLWVAIVALAIDVLIYAGVVPVSEEAALKGFVQRALEALVLLGIISNPTKPDGKGFNL